MPNRLLYSLFPALLTTTNVVATAADKKLSCYAKHLDTDNLVEVKIVSSIASKKIATAQWPLGYPTIAIDNSAFVKLTKNTRQFIYYHECAHLTLRTKDEHEADCESINILMKKHHYKELDVRKLVKNLSEEFGLSQRWSDLLACNGLIK